MENLTRHVLLCGKYNTYKIERDRNLVKTK